MEQLSDVSRTKSTLLGGLRSTATCRNAGLHSGGRKIHGKDGVAGSIPAGGSTPRLTSGNAGLTHIGDERLALFRKGCAQMSLDRDGYISRLTSRFRSLTVVR